jgi:hypothetical protein
MPSLMILMAAPGCAFDDLDAHVADRKDISTLLSCRICGRNTHLAVPFVDRGVVVAAARLAPGTQGSANQQALQAHAPGSTWILRFADQALALAWYEAAPVQVALGLHAMWLFDEDGQDKGQAQG